MCGDGNMMGWMWLGGVIWFTLIAAGIGLVVWAIVRGMSGGQQVRHAGEDRALASLRDRFARGEIDEAEFQRRRRILASHEVE